MLQLNNEYDSDNFQHLIDCYTDNFKFINLFQYFLNFRLCEFDFSILHLPWNSKVFEWFHNN
jgi:hypothetical protein